MLHYYKHNLHTINKFNITLFCILDCEYIKNVYNYVNTYNVCETRDSLVKGSYYLFVMTNTIMEYIYNIFLSQM